MKSRLALALLLFALAAAGILGFLALGKREAPRSPEESVPPTWTTAREAPMHVRHVGELKLACNSCHERAGDVPTAAVCRSCHEKEAAKNHHGSAGEPTTCLSCHAFGKAAPRACSDCHAKGKRATGAPALAHHADANVPCGSCHRVHSTEPTAPADCTSCHRSTSARHGRFAIAASEHIPPASDPPLGTFASDAAAIAFLGGESPAKVCATCHAPHTGRAEAQAACAACHDGAHAGAPAAVPRGRNVAGHAACTTCHEPHRAQASDVRACTACHDDHRAAETRGHTSCTSCHTPHAPAEAKASCAQSCHRGVTALGAERAPAHADCTSCHDAHRPSALPGDACRRCHESTSPSHPSGASAQSCTGCHPPHGKTGRGEAAVLVAHEGREARAVSCTSCHTALGGDHSAHAGKLECTQCHTPHAFRLTGLGANLCARCHADQQKRALPGHASCEGCHKAAHAPTKKPACGGCHAAESSTAPTGHASCTSCHDAHSGDRKPSATCASCHANKESTLHAHVTKEGCASCHRPHGPKGPASPPTCTTCHDRPLPGLHAKSSHAASCTSCHASHSPPRADRSTCTASCHVDRQSHQPQAKACNGCHLFRQ